MPPGRSSKRWYQRWWVWLVAVIAIVIIGVVVLLGVFGSKYQLESKITDLAKDQGQTISDVDCPNAIDTDKGNEYDCTAVLAGKDVILHVRFVSDRTFTISDIRDR